MKRFFAALIPLALTAIVTTAQADDPFPDLDPAALNTKCATYAGQIGKLTVKYAYRNWEGIIQNKTAQFVMTNTSNCTNGQAYNFAMKKVSAGAPPFTTVVPLIIDAGLKGMSDNGGTKATECQVVVPPWSTQALVADGFQLTRAQKDAIERNSRDVLCLSLAKALNDAVRVRMNQILSTLIL